MNTPLVRVIVLTFDGGQMTLDCLDSLLATDWPADRLQIVVVDNGSLDDVADRVRAEYPQVTLLEPLVNLGFAGGCNLGMRLPGQHEFIALVNNDATVERTWLRPLVHVADSAEDIGAVSPKMVFADRFLGVDLTVPGVSTSKRGKPEKGVRVSGARIDGVRADDRVSFNEDFYGADQPDLETDEELARWTCGRGSIHIAVDPGTALPQCLSLRLSNVERRIVTLSSEASQQTIATDSEAEWFDIHLEGEPFDVINNVGSNLYRGGFGGDRGFLERDLGQYEQPAEVFAWCGGAVLLKRAYLEQVGLFDEQLFLYYEDTDLSWRGRLRGWRYMFEPTAVVRHRHAQSSGVGSPTFRFYTERNRLLVLAKNAPARLALRAGLGEIRRFVRSALSGYIGRPIRLQMPERRVPAHRRRVLISYLRLLPAMLRERRATEPVVSRRHLMTSWEVTK